MIEGHEVLCHHHSAKSHQGQSDSLTNPLYASVSYTDQRAGHIRVFKYSCTFCVSTIELVQAEIY